MRLQSLLAAATLLICSNFVALADTLTVFNATGTFASGSKLSGTITIDTTDGVLASSTLVVSAPDSLNFSFVQDQFTNPSIYVLQFGTTAAGLPSLALGVSVTDLVGYSGGAFASLQNRGPGGVSNVAYESSADLLSVGGLSVANPQPGAATPEPSSFALLAMGVAGVAGIARRKLSRR